MIACYLELYEEGEVEHINDVWPNSKHLQLVGSSVLLNAHRKRLAHAQKLPYKYPTVWSHFDLLKASPYWKWVGGTIDMLDFTFFI